MVSKRMKIIAGCVAILCCIVQIIFQFCLALGAEWSDIAWGGQSGSGESGGELPIGLRIASGISTFIWLFALSVTLQRSRLLIRICFSQESLRRLDPCYKRSALFLTLLFGVSTILNAISRSPKERLWTPFVLVCCISFGVLSRDDDVEENLQDNDDDENDDENRSLGSNSTIDEEDHQWEPISEATALIASSVREEEAV